MKNIAKALLACQKAIKPVKADSVNPHFKSTYADLESVWGAVREALHDNGLIVVQGAEIEPTQHIYTRIIHADSGEQIESRTPLILTKQDPQGVGSAFTYYRRYAIAAMLGLVQTDDDGESAVRGGKPQAAKPQGDSDQYKKAQAAIAGAKSKTELDELAVRVKARHANGTFTDDMALALSDLITETRKTLGGK